MNVLLVNSPVALKFRGGDLTQMRQTAAALAALRVRTGESFDRRPDPAGYDLAHVFNLRTIDVTPGQVRHLKQRGLPVVMSPIYLDPGLPTWGREVIPYAFQAARSEEERDRLLADVAARRL